MSDAQVKRGMEAGSASTGAGAPPRLEVGSANTREALRAQLGEHEYRTLEGPAGALLVQRLGPGSQTRGRVLMAGELVSRMTVIEILNMITAVHWRGELHIISAAGRRTLTIDQGALKYAQTTVEGERLGELLLRTGVIDRDGLREAVSQKSPDERLGEVLIRQGLLNQEQLFEQLQQHIESIFFSSLLEESGAYWFVAPPEDAPPPPTTVHVPVQALLMEGVQRLDEMALYRERIPHNRVFATATGVQAILKKEDPLEPFMLEVLDKCDGTRNVNDLSRDTGWGEFPVLKALYNLQRSGLIKLRRGPVVDPRAARKLVRHFNDLVRDVFVVVATYGSMEAASGAVSAWLTLSPHAELLGSKVDIDGTLDSEHVIAQLQASSSDDPMAALHQALHELAAYALFRASMGLPRHEEQALSRHVNHRLKQMRL